MKKETIKGYKVGSNKFYLIDFQLMGVRFRKRGFVSKKEALLVVSKARKDILMGCFDEDDYKAKKSESTTVSEYFHSVYWEQKAPKIKESTRYIRYAAWEGSILPYWKNKKLSSVSQTTVDKWLAGLHQKKGISPIYQYSLATYLMLLVKHANLTGTLSELPEVVKPKYTLAKSTFFTATQMNKVLATDKGGRGNDLIHILFYLALRYGEAVALTVQDVDLDGGTVRVNKRLYKGKLDTIKNGKTANLPIHPELRPVLERLVQEAGDEGQLFAKKGRGASPRKAGNLGKTEASRSVNKVIEKALGKGAPTGTHIFRRSMGNLLVEKGVPLNQVAYLLRDTEATVMKHYSKVNKTDAHRNIQSFSVR